MAAIPAEMEKRPETASGTVERIRSGRVYRPNVDICESDDELTLFADMPGTSSDGIEINFENGTLAIHGKVEARQQGRESLLREYGIGDFYRSFQVDESVASDRISAEYADGVLILHLPKVEAAKPRKIAVQSK